MTVEEKRDALIKYCHNASCINDSCPLQGKTVCTCGCGKTFLNTPDDMDHYMTDAEIVGAYEMVFGQKTEELTESVLGTIHRPDSVVINGNIEHLTINYFTREVE